MLMTLDRQQSGLDLNKPVIFFYKNLAPLHFVQEVCHPISSQSVLIKSFKMTLKWSQQTLARYFTSFVFIEGLYTVLTLGECLGTCLGFNEAEDIFQGSVCNQKLGETDSRGDVTTQKLL